MPDVSNVPTPVPDDDELYDYSGSTWEDIVIDLNYLDEDKITEEQADSDASPPS